MAFMNQEHKKQIEPIVKDICKRHGMKATMGVHHHSTLVLNVASGPINFLTPYNERNLARCKEQGFNCDYPPATYFAVNEYHIESNYTGKSLAFLTEVYAAMNAGNWDKSDIMTDYFNVGWYVDINIGKYNKPYLFTPESSAAPVVTAAPCLNCEPLQLPGATIQEHTHTKKGYQMFIVVLGEKVSRDEYLNLLERAKDLGGWYSRAWGTSPAGFAFLEREQADQFVGTLTLEPIDPGTGTDTPNCNQLQSCPEAKAKTAPKLTLAKPNLSGKLRTIAEKMQGLIDSAFADRITNTQKRLCQAMGARCEGEKLLRTQKVLLALADLHEAGTVPAILARFSTKAAVFDLMGSKKLQVANGYHSYFICEGKPYHDTPETFALWELLTEKSPEQKAVEELQRKIEGLQFSNIPGFFPTPENIIDMMIERAELEKDHTVLEPNLGSCAIADRLADLCIKAQGYEVNYTLAEICQAKGYLLERRDFLTVTAEKRYERIMMNPPFEKGQDIAHIKHALTMLTPGGKLVAICAAGPRQLEALQPLCSSWEELPQGSFKSSGTGVNSVLLTIDA